MKRNLSLWQLAGFAFTALGGTLLHFLFDWTNKSVLVAPFSAVNESTWEHMKLLFFPMFVFALIESRFFKEHENFWCVKLVGIITGVVLIPILFYTYNGVFGKSSDWINITIFFISAAASFIVETRLFKQNRLECNRPRLAFLLICVIGIMFIIFTFATPQIPLFADPLSDLYGLDA
ncbi:MAG: hypothetical protein J6Q67_06725 [Clostridia bacterium]|nr:hypothetical protein [Clostridia bacterium]